jgi:hypothetical protein
MADYSHLKRLGASEQTEREYIFDDIVLGQTEDGVDISPSIWFRPMTDANPAYMNERVRLAVEKAEKDSKQPARSKAERRKELLAGDRIEEDRDMDRVLIARCCAVRWGTPMPDAAGAVHDLDEEEAYSFLCALPSHIIDPLRGWVQNIYNFVDRYALTEQRTETLGN